MKKSILLAALAVATIAGSAMAQTATTPSATMPTPAAPTAVMPSTPMPTTTGTTPAASAINAPAAVLVDRQKMDEALSSDMIGAAVYAANGERVGDVNDLVIDTTGRISGVVIGVGGVLGMGEKNVAVEYGSVTKGKDDSGRARLTVHLTKDALKAAAPYVPVKKS